MIKSEKGQLSIFFGTTMLVVIGIIAFIINIGYFVKAKINLQNAVDAAAFAGASVQARQLTNIAYLNWEMRNTYKEWMFKYYVLGNLNTDAIKGSSSLVDFRMKSAPGTLTSDGGDQYNFPSTCIDFSNTGNVGVCNLYKIPGLPRFESYNVQGMTETTNAIIDAIVAEKSEDCSKRSQLNFSTSNLWAYNITPKEGTTSLIKDAPAIATDRQGAFPAAFELAIRMRNLEKQVNKAPYTDGVCYEKGSFNSSFCSQTLSQVVQNQSVGNERINKAFLSAWRNLGGSAPNDILKSSFTLKEIAPSPFEPTNSYSLSSLLIPGSKKYPKYYLDLKLMTVNYATFYTAFVTRQDTSSSVAKEAECEATKTGLPVPGYPLGFVKNPNVLTYYAVKGEANFVGLFNPFNFDEGIKLTAVAAAKPFGARIGPNLFDLKGNEQSQVLPMTSSSGIYRSSGYSLGLQKGGSNTNFEPGDPLPIGDFWQSSVSQAIGGWINGENIRFVIPNLIYDYPNSIGDSPTGFLSEEPIAIVRPGGSISLDAGLFNSNILNKFTNNINVNDLSPEGIKRGILSARAPTQYDLANYLVPSTEELNEDLKISSFAFIPKGSAASNSLNSENSSVYNYEIYAPVFSDDEDTLYSNVNDVIGVFNEYLLNQRPSIKKYLNSMKLTAANIFNNNYSTSDSGSNTGADAARVIADIPDEFMTGTPTADEAKVTCSSIAGTFVYFYTGDLGLVRNDNNSCTDLDNLPKLLESYWSQNKDQLGEYYQSQFSLPNNSNIRERIFNAYRPSESKDTNNGIFTNNLRSRQVNMKRNFYSTKFVSLNALIGNQGGYSPSTNFPIFSDGPRTNAASSFPASEISNPLDPQSVDFNPDKVSH